MPPPPRSGVAATTQPPLEDAPARLASKLNNWKAIVMVFAAVGGCVAATVAGVVKYDGGVAKRQDVAAERSFAAGVAADVRALEGRFKAHLQRDLWRDAVLAAIANKVGAVVPPLPPPEEP